MTGDAPYLQIGEVAARTELSLRSLRHWEEVGLLRPSGRSDGGFRLYSDTDVADILVIRRMKPLGFSLGEMAEVMTDIGVLREAPDDAELGAARARLEAVRQDALARRARLERHLGMADEFLSLLDEQVTHRRD